MDTIFIFNLNSSDLDGIQLIRGELELATCGLTVTVSKDLKENSILLYSD
jgi:hypothetical protein